MNVLMLVDWSYPCDHQFLTQVYANRFVERGHSVTWLMRPSTDTDTVTPHTWNGSDVYVLPNAAYDPIRTYLTYRTGRIESHPLFSTDIDFEEFDLLHVRNDLSMGVIATHLSSTYDIPYAHQISHLKAEALIESAQQGFDSTATRLKGHLGTPARKRISRNADLLLPISQAMCTYLEHRGYTTPMETLPTGAPIIDGVPDPEPFKEAYDLDADYLLLYLGSMSPYRRLEFCFDVLDRVRDSYDAELVMMGGRSESDRARLKAEARKRNIASKVTFTGWVEDRTEINRAIAAADIGLSPFPTDSILHTNAPIKTLEYQSLGTPVVASATQDQRDVLETSEGGYAVPYEVAAFTEAIGELLGDSGKRETMGENGREYIRNHRNFDVLTDRVEEIYTGLLS